MTTEAVYAYYPVFARMPGLEPPAAQQAAEDLAELEDLFEKYSDRVTVRGTYSATGFRPDADLFFWWVGPSAGDLQQLYVDFRRLRVASGLSLTQSFLGVTRPAEFNPDHLPSFLKGEEPRRYLTVYPFVRTEEWYLLDPSERGRLLREHGQMGREFPDVLPNTTSAFGLGDWEWILAFESDDLTKIVDCIRRLRQAEARRYTKLDIPFVLGIRTELAEALGNLS